MIDDSSLCRIIKQALQDSEGDQYPHNAVEVLALVIDQLPEVKAYLGKGWLPYYDEALPMTMRDVYRNIRKFPTRFKLDMASVNCQNPSEAGHIRKCFVRWVVMILKRDCFDVMRLRDKRPQTFGTMALAGVEYDSFAMLDNVPGTEAFPTAIDRLIQQEQLLAVEELKRYIEQDPEEKLRNCQPRGRPNCNCQTLSQKILLANSPNEIIKITKELNIPYQTLLAHWKRKCIPLLQEIARDFGL
jgi:hypothetical protein